MAVERQFIVKLLADPKQLIQDFQLIRGEADKTFGIANDKITKLLPGFKVLTSVAAGVFGGLVAGAGLAVKAAAENEAAQNRLRTILLQTGKASETQIEALNAQADALERVGVVAGGNITVLQSQLATFDLQAETIQTLTPAIADYVVAEKGATATAEDFKSMTNGLAQALNGQFGALTRVGFVLDDVTKETISNGTEAERAAALVSVLSSTYGGFNAQLRNTTEGQMMAFRNSLGKLQEDLGKILLPLFNAAVTVLAKFAQFAANNSTAVGILAGVLGVLSAAVLGLAAAIKIAAFQKQLLNNEFTKGIATMKNAEGQLTLTGKAVVGLGKGLAVLALAEGTFAVLNAIGDTAAKTSDQVKRLTVAINEFGKVGETDPAKVVEEFSKLARTIQDEFRLSDAVKEFGRDFQFFSGGVKVNIESADEAFRKFLDQDPAKAAAIVQALQDQLAVTDPTSRSYKDLKDAIDRYRGAVNLTLAAQGKLNTELSKTSWFEKNTKGLADLKVAHNAEARARLASADSITDWNKAADQLFNKASTGTSVTNKLAEAKKKLQDATKGLASATISNRDANERVADSAKKVELADQGVTKAKEALAQAIRGYGKDSQEGQAAATSLAAAQRNLTRADFGVVDSQTKVAEAQKKLSDLRANDKTEKIAAAFKDLTRAQDEAGEAADKVVSAQDALKRSSEGVEKAKEKLSLALRGFGRESKEGAAATRNLANAQRDLTKANLAVTDAQNKVIEAQRKLDELRNKAADPDKVSFAEFGLEKAKLDVEEATLRVSEAEEKLAETLKDPEASPIEKRRAELALVAAKFALRQSIIDQGESEQELIAIRNTGATADELAEAERNLQDAKLAVEDALDRQTQATEDLAEANDNYRKIVEGIRKGDKEYVELSDDLLKAIDGERDAKKFLGDAVKDQSDAQESLNKAEQDYNRVKASGPTPEELLEAERDLELAKLGVADAIDAQKKAQQDLILEQENYRKVTEGILKDDKEFVLLSDAVVKAEEAQRDAAKELRDAREGAAKATDTLREAEEELRASRKELRVARTGAPGRAFGGPVIGGRPYIVGERGPEMFVPSGSGKIVPNNKMNGGGTVVNVVVNAGVGTSGTQVGQEIVDVLRQYTKVSGPLSNYVAV